MNKETQINLKNMICFNDESIKQDENGIGSSIEHKILDVIYKEETMEYDDEVDVSQEVADKIDKMIIKGELNG